MRVALTIAGSDSSGGAGIQADLKTFHRFRVFGTSVITAITAQNTTGVMRWQAVEPDMVRAQIDAVATDVRSASVKSGMLADAGIIDTVADALLEHSLANYVLDPVMVATSGDLLIEKNAVAALRDRLIPLATIVTPNGDEATVLTGIPLIGEDEMYRAAEAIIALGAKAVLIKGGHVQPESATMMDLLYDGEFTAFSHPRLRTNSTHGTGCTLSAAIAAELANRRPLRDSVASAIDYVHAAIESAPRIGSGHGPLNHFARGSSPTKARTSD
ncbi:MAG TPA: bifunctional hydroxymethylpyrimidine kinase/phosphomethylpyrimidine kinase [Gemmatimonadaceae bacterium]|nr:bifunctional hydroxymethylpyrimidine kinase/phosphomethylpyrimidine kinase [Gemmatimonadaceae bacterium]